MEGYLIEAAIYQLEEDGTHKIIKVKYDEEGEEIENIEID